ncbi:VWA domain-containing protein [Lutibacter sp. HS1-25]|uniref:VWA domain-containing protein n=1 Tax=Lutibacter sp. HS1-25 TaxID=2485000 RepID=UPI001010DCE5|nr:VWA domain-containing protein [Lutibacter sp. HS1-25]RXP57074.1 VWA domain-containing protein [Lutibacter sp. HS1-25]
METANLLYIIIAVFVALFLSIFQYIFQNKEKSQFNYWLSFLRFLSLFSIFLLLINPSIKKETSQIIKPNLVVAVDNSSSIKFKSKAENIQNLVETIKNDAELNSKFNIEYFSFGTKLKPLDSLNFNEQYTNLFDPLNKLSKVFNNGINPLVLITDGNQTAGNSIAFSNYKSPVYSFVVGDTTTVEDIFIQQLNVNENTFVNNQFPVEVFVNYTGNQNISKNLSVFNNGKMVFSKKINFSKTQNVYTESLFLTSKNKGINYYTVQIDELINEQNTINNSKEFSINVIEDTSKILILTAVLHPDLGMFKKAIESNKQRSVTILNIDKYKSESAKYQLIILYQPNNKFKNVLNEIQTKKMNYFIVSGLSTDWNFLNLAQSNFTKKVISSSENYNAVFNNSYSSFLNSDIGFSTFAPLEDRFGSITFSVPYQTLLFQKIGSVQTEEPLLATFENNNQKGAVLFGENIWRWRMGSFSESKTFEYFDGFIANLMQYLASNNNNNRLNASVNPIYFSNETIQISANYLDENLNLDNRAKIWLTITNKEDKKQTKIPFALVNNGFVAQLSNIASGEYLYSVSVENHDETISGAFKVLPYEIEQQFTQSNDADLKLLASTTNGKVYYDADQTVFINDLVKDKRFKSIQKSSTLKTPLINWKWLLGFIVFCLSLEWFTRKYVGKI